MAINVVQAIYKLYTYRSEHINDLIFNIIYYKMYSTENMYVEYLIYLLLVLTEHRAYFSSLSHRSVHL